MEIAYRGILRRPPDPEGKAYFIKSLASGRMNRESLLREMLQSREFKSLKFDNMILSVHNSRLQWIQSLPKAEFILDLGGAAKDSKFGALVAMGYPYKFKNLTIVDLPLVERHSLYSNGYRIFENIDSPYGKIDYIHTSMTNLSQFADSSMDLIHCGQSIEHIPEQDANIVFKESFRILKPGHFFVLDTPNAKATRLQSDCLIDPDHKVEYQHDELRDKLLQAGFAITQTKGLNYLACSIENGLFDEAEVTRNYGIYDDIENCYILAYWCQKPILSPHLSFP